MNSFKIPLFKGFIWGVVTTYFMLALIPIAIENQFLNVSCSSSDKKWAQNFVGHYVFDRVSLKFWRANCAPEKPLLLISASEGTSGYKFSQALFDQAEIPTWEFRGAHRGLKTYAYMTSRLPIKETQLPPTILLVNPVYFSFAARTDDTSMKRSALSALPFIIHQPHWKYKFQSPFLSLPFITFKEFLKEWGLAHQEISVMPKLAAKKRIQKPLDEDYDFKHHMLKKKVSTYKGGLKKDQFLYEIPPINSMMKRIIGAIDKHNLKVCLVMLPLNEQHLIQVRNDTEKISQSIKKSVRENIPPHLMVDMMDFGKEPYLFKDTMHFTDYGVQFTVETVLKSDCYKRIRP